MTVLPTRRSVDATIDCQGGAAADVWSDMSRTAQFTLEVLAGVAVDLDQDGHPTAEMAAIYEQLDSSTRVAGYGPRDRAIMTAVQVHKVPGTDRFVARYEDESTTWGAVFETLPQAKLWAQAFCVEQLAAMGGDLVDEKGDNCDHVVDCCHIENWWPRFGFDLPETGRETVVPLIAEGVEPWFAFWRSVEDERLAQFAATLRAERAAAGMEP